MLHSIDDSKEVHSQHLRLLDPTSDVSTCQHWRRRRQLQEGCAGASCRKGVQVPVQLEMALVLLTFSVLAEPENRTAPARIIAYIVTNKIYMYKISMYHDVHQRDSSIRHKAAAAQINYSE